MALDLAGGTCESISDNGTGWECQNAIDGAMNYAVGTAWAAASGASSGTWIRIIFARVYTIVRGRFLSNTEPNDAFKDIRLLFDDGSSVQVIFGHPHFAVFSVTSLYVIDCSI